MNMESNNSNENREKERDRRGRGARGSRFSDADGNGSAGGGGGKVGGGSGGGSNVRDRSREQRNCRVYISNIPYDYRWQDLKDLFRRIVGSIEYVQLFHDESGKARGCGIVEFKDPENVQKAMEKMNRYEVNGRELVVKEDHGEQRDQYGRIVRDGAGGGNGGGNGGGGGGGGRDHLDDRDRGFSLRDDDILSGRNNFNMMSNDYNNSSNYNLYGLSSSFLESLGISGPLHNKVFVANLDYKVDSKKLKQVFKLAGKVQSMDLSLDKEGNSRGFAVIEYDHPVEAVQAISMLDRQMLYDRRMTVRLDRIPDKSEGLKLPEGLGGVGIGLGPNGEPLKDVAHNLPNGGNRNQSQLLGHVQQNPQLGVASGGGQLGVGVTNPSNLLSNLGGVMFGQNSAVQPSPVAPVQKPNLGNQSGGGVGGVGLNLNNLNPSNLAAVVGNLGNLGAALSNPLLTSSLSTLGLNLGNAGGNDEPMSGTNAGLSNNYSSGGSGGGGGNSYSSGGANNYSGGGGVVGVSGNVGYNAYSSSGNGGGIGGIGGGGVDNNDYKSGNNLDMFGGGGGGVGGGVGGNVGNSHVGGGNSGAGGRKTDTIIVKNLPMTCTWQTLRDKFREIGDVKFAEIRGNDVGVVRFFKERDAELAVGLMDGSRLDGRSIKVSYF